MSFNQKKTVCFFNTNKAWGGGEKWHLRAANEFKRCGLETILITHENSQLAIRGRELGQNVYKFRVGNLSFLNPIKIFIFFLFFKIKKIHTVIINLPSDLKIAGPAAKMAGVRKIIYRRGMTHPLRNSFLNRFLFIKILDHIVVNSEEIGRNLSQGNENWFPKEKMLLIYNGVDTGIEINKTQGLYRKKNQEIVIGNAGRLTEQKGQKYLIELGRNLKSQGLNFKILIAGEGELRSELQKLIHQNDLTEEIELLGEIRDMSSFYYSLDIFVFTSLFEGSANTLIETLQHGIPVVAWDISSNPEIIKAGKTGYLVPPFDINVMKDCILNLWNDKDLREEVSLAGRELIKEHFDEKKNLKKLMSLL